MEQTLKQISDFAGPLLRLLQIPFCDLLQLLKAIRPYLEAGVRFALLPHALPREVARAEYGCLIADVHLGVEVIGGVEANFPVVDCLQKTCDSSSAKHRHSTSEPVVSSSLVDRPGSFEQASLGPERFVSKDDVDLPVPDRVPSEKYQEVLQRRKRRYDQQIRGALVELLDSAFDRALPALQIE